MDYCYGTFMVLFGDLTATSRHSHQSLYGKKQLEHSAKHLLCVSDITQVRNDKRVSK